MFKTKEDEIPQAHFSEFSDYYGKVRKDGMPD